MLVFPDSADLADEVRDLLDGRLVDRTDPWWGLAADPVAPGGLLLVSVGTGADIHPHTCRQRSRSGTSPIRFTC